MQMFQGNNLSSQMEKQIPAGLVEFMQEAELVAAGLGQKIYLVGGMVRDLLLERSNLDLDLVVAGDAIDLARKLAGITGARMTTHPHFHTANLRWQKQSIDLTSARSETYSRPGALPTVRPGALDIDLFRRDFTINTLAIELIPNRWGEIIDLYGGRDDLEKGLLRVLHEGSFIDDATRIWRGLRYEQRLNFKLEPKTLRLLKRDVTMLETISNDRIRHELELVLAEAFPEKVIIRADKLKVLAELHPALKGDPWLTRKFNQARRQTSPGPPPVGLYFALLAYRLTPDQNEKLISWLRLSKSHSLTLRDTIRLKAGLELLAEPGLAPGRIYSALRDYAAPALTANHLATDSSTVKRHIRLYQNKLRHVRPALTGDDLQKMGISPGPRMKEILHQLLQAKLDGQVTDKHGEVEMVEEKTR